MDPSEALSVHLSLHDALTTQLDALAADALISAFAAATRLPSCAVPFPTHLFEGSRRHEQARQALNSIPPVTQVLAAIAAAAAEGGAREDGPEGAPKLSDDAWRLLQWLLLLLAPQRGCLRATSPEHVAEAVSIPPLVKELSKCSCILEVQRPAAVRQEYQHSASMTEHQAEQDERDSSSGGAPPLFCWHGTSFSRLHSILHQGLLNATGTRAASNGALFGAGIYASTHMHTAFSFTSASRGWDHSAIGARLRCMLLCSVSPAAAQELVQRRAGDGGLPGTYIVVSNPRDMSIRYVLLWSDDGVVRGGGWGTGAGLLRTGPSAAGGMQPGGGRSGTPPATAGGVAQEQAAGRRQQGLRGGHAACWWLTAIYLGVMLLIAVCRLFRMPSL